MKNNYLPFQIGEQYENWEFDLDYLKEERIKGLDSYLYIKKSFFLQYNARRIELIFALDILEVVIMTFEFQSFSELNQFREALQRTFGKKVNLQDEDLKSIAFKLTDELGLRFTHFPLEYRVNVCYGSEKYLKFI